MVTGLEFPDRILQTSPVLFARVAKLSKAEEDRRRREGGGSNKTFLAVGVAIVVIVAVLIVINQDSGPGDSKAENLAAFGLADDPYMGDPGAPVVLVGFEAPTCSACKGFHSNFLPQLKADYFDTGKAVYYYSQYEISPVDFSIGNMQECALHHAGNDGYWNFTDMIYLELGLYPSEAAARAKYDQFGSGHPAEADLQECADTTALGGRVSSDYRIGRDWNVRGTPTFYVFGLDGAPSQVGMSQIAQAIDELQP